MKEANDDLQMVAEGVVQVKEGDIEKELAEKVEKVVVVVVVVENAYNAYAQHGCVRFDDMVCLDIDLRAQVDDARFLIKYYTVSTLNVI